MELKKCGPFEVKREHKTPHVQLTHAQSHRHSTVIPLPGAEMHELPEPDIADETAVKEANGPVEARNTGHLPHVPLRPALQKIRARFRQRRLPIILASPTETEEVEQSPYRNFGCANYDRCLSLAAALDWDSFSCSGCDEQINEQLIWRAHHRLRAEPQLAELFDLPVTASGETGTTVSLGEVPPLKS